ncbi:MAG TPA: ABC transporter substrate-binding protein [Candidatus Methylomirabilis sp.]|nr:ABC transporter substrate-binding protein [Candidatus Methylomirabilis sp.]
MRRTRVPIAISLAVVCFSILVVLGARAAETPRRGGILTFVVSEEPSSYDGHREDTFAMLHWTRPFYSVLIRENPANPASPTDFVGDVALEVPEPTDGGKKYTFRLRKDAKFWDGQPVTAHDVVASFKKIIFPPEGVVSTRKAFFSMVDKVSATDDTAVVFELKYPSSAFIPALANPFNYLYSAKKLAQDVRWYEKNILGSGPFIFVKHERGQFLEGKRNPNYHYKGQPYLDGFRAVLAKQQSEREKAIREGEAMIDFRGFPPRSRDIFVRALGDQITVQESDWNCVLLVTPNHRTKPFDDPRVRRALTLAIDRWGGSQDLSRVAIVKTVGGVVFPGHPLAATRMELQQIAGYWPDLGKSRAEARWLLHEAGVPEGFSFKFNVRDVDQPYKIVGSWLVTQWQSIGLMPEQSVQAGGPFLKALRNPASGYQVSIDFNCQAVVNPPLDVSKFISRERSDINYANYNDEVLDSLFDKMNRTTDAAEQRRLMRQFERRVLDEQAHMFVTLWWYRIVPHRSIVKGWMISPSHYLNQDLATVWLAQ